MAKTPPELKARQEFLHRLKHGLVTQPVYQTCAHCRKEISSSIEWACGYCGYENRQTAIYAIFFKCQQCGAEPLAYVCPECNSTNSLNINGDLSRPAHHAPRRKAIQCESSPGVSEKRRRDLELHKEDLERQIEIAQLEIKLASLKKSDRDEQASYVIEKIRNQIKSKAAEAMGVRLVMREIRAQAAVDYKDDPEMMELIDEALNWIYEKDYM